MSVTKGISSDTRAACYEQMNRFRMQKLVAIPRPGFPQSANLSKSKRDQALQMRGVGWRGCQKTSCLSGWLRRPAGRRARGNPIKRCKSRKRGAILRTRKSPQFAQTSWWRTQSAQTGLHKLDSLFIREESEKRRRFGPSALAVPLLTSAIPASTALFSNAGSGN
jgi:hypothetical protein